MNVVDVVLSVLASCQAVRPVRVAAAAVHADFIVYGGRRCSNA